MKQTLKTTDIIALGFMLFAFFLGAGNIIFPPQAGQFAGEHYISAMGGFLLTAVGLPLLSLIAIAIAGGSWEAISQELPRKISVLIVVVMFIIIGPAFAIPRTAAVSFDMAIKPFIGAGSDRLAIFSGVFFMLVIVFALRQGRLIDTIGKLLTPVLLIGLIVLSLGVFLAPQGHIIGAKGHYIDMPLASGFLDGYNTMDTFGALLFGMLMVDAIGSKGITQKKAVARYLFFSALIAAAGLAFVYVSLFYLGATSSQIAAHAKTGSDILSIYVQSLFGPYGQWVLSTIVLLACLTTAIGLTSASSEYFSRLSGVGVRYWVVGVGVLSAIITNIGLKQLINLSIPVLLALYPTIIMLVLLTFIRHKLANPKLVYRFVLAVSFIFSLIDVIHRLDLNVYWFDRLPLLAVGMGWLCPTLIILVAMLVIDRVLPFKLVQSQSIH
ncbi:branched-chain amino acid transport system II carrier protein [Celerinatantimonas diazotrophica]|uniref:Branched-chain amino acid transport system carrier protein n=1 Tax=Celerinatantimonas diazotrophica TaxID=412034 RepID=A0A4R1K6G2_9GAMM|nr:branched-chain amino acid transport system II carrier protein [Celerinatantimonas diazotrophica]TCK59784.1 LIVCS family branched-chain amino acid:cation transporter [Celerinatantimonas diazotrophica]